MFSKRGVLGFFSGLFSWLVAKKVEAEPIPVLKPEWTPQNFEKLPTWCPEGFIPMMGQDISRDQFPSLFDVVQFERKNGSKGRYLPPFFGGERGVLPLRPPQVPTELQAHGWIDNLTRVSRKEADTRILVHLMATRPQVSCNGRVSQAGFGFVMPVERKDFEAFYGPIKGSGKNMFLSGYEIVEPY